MNTKLNVLMINLAFFTFLKADFDPKSYRESNARQVNLATQELPKLQLSGNEVVLDIGSGDGGVSSYIAQQYIPNGSLVGIDNNENMITFAATHNECTNVSYICADGAKHIEHEKYDVVVSFSTLHWIPDYAKVLQNIYSCLKPGGQALLCHGAETPPAPLIIRKLLNTPKWSDYKENAALLQYPSLTTIARAIADSGLYLESFEFKKQHKWIRPDLLIKNWLSLPLIDFIPSELRQTFWQDVVEEWIKEEPLNENSELDHWAPVVVIYLKKPLNG